MKRGILCLACSTDLFLRLTATGTPPQIFPKPCYAPDPLNVEGRCSRSPYTKPIVISHLAVDFFLDGVYQALPTLRQRGYSQTD